MPSWGYGVPGFRYDANGCFWIRGGDTLKCAQHDRPGFRPASQDGWSRRASFGWLDELGEDWRGQRLALPGK